jgi:hypothetical protein
MDVDKDTQATLHHRKFSQADKMIASGRLEDMVRQFRAFATSMRQEYFIMVGEMEYGPHEIEDLAKKLHID